MAEPESTEVHPGKLNIMVGDLANERFDIAYVGGSPGGSELRPHIARDADFHDPADGNDPRHR